MEQSPTTILWLKDTNKTIKERMNNMLNWIFSKLFDGTTTHQSYAKSTSVANKTTINAGEGKKAKVIINGIEVEGNGINITEGKIFVDGVEYPSQLGYNLSITVQGDVHSIETGAGDVQCENVTGDIKSGAGDVQCMDVGGNVTTGVGNVYASRIAGNVSSGLGDIHY